MKKICPGCGEERDAEKDFRWKYKDRGIRQRWCKYCQATANKDHYRNNKQDYLDRALTRNARVKTENRQRLYAYLSEHPCVDCGETDVRVLEFDHVRGNKSANICWFDSCLHCYIMTLRRGKLLFCIIFVAQKIGEAHPEKVAIV